MDRILSYRNIAAFYLVLMCVAILPLEGWGASRIKVGAMALAPLIMLIKAPVISKAMLWGMIYMLYIVFDLLLLNLPFRGATVIYLAMYVMMFVMYYNLIHTGAFTMDFYIKLISGLIYAFTICLVLQQLAILMGVRYFPPLNLMGQEYLVVTKVNSLTWEPSISARIMAVSFLAFLKVNEIKNGAPLSIKQLFGSYRWLTLGFLYAMVTMGSGTAFVALAVLSLYFLKKQYVAFIVPSVLALCLALPLIDYEPLNRAVGAFETITSDDPNQIVRSDRSASVRIKPFINTITNLDLSDKKSWFGEGTDATQKYSVLTKHFDKQMIGMINDFGIIGFILGVILIAVCCLPRFFSLETLLMFTLVWLTVNNVSYIWGIYMIFVPVKYFYQTNQAGDERPEPSSDYDDGTL